MKSLSFQLLPNRRRAPINKVLALTVNLKWQHHWGSGQVLLTCRGRNKTLLPSTSLLVMGEIAGVNTASLGGYLHSSKTRARWAEGFHNELNSHVS